MLVSVVVSMATELPIRSSLREWVLTLLESRGESCIQEGEGRGRGRGRGCGQGRQGGRQREGARGIKRDEISKEEVRWR